MREYFEIMRDLRETRGFNQTEVAKVMGVTQQVYSRYENGINEMPIRFVKILCSFYEISADEFLGINQRKG